MEFLGQTFTTRLIEAISWTILHSFWQVSVVVLLSAVVLMLLRKKASSIRYLVTLIGFGLIVGWSAVTFVEYYNTNDSTEIGFQSAAYLETTSEKNPNSHSQGILKITQFGEKIITGFSGLSSNPNLIVICWSLGVGFLVIKLSGGILFSVIKARRGKIIADKKLIALVGRLNAKMHIKQAVRVFYSINVSVPSVIGVLKPVILIPVGMFSGIPANQVEAIIAHELAHIKRLDVLVNIIQSFIEVVFFYHPGIWWLSKVMRSERENCSDDLALKLCDEPITYIKALSNIEEFRLTKSNIMVALSNNKEHLLSRIKRMVTGKNQTIASPVFLLAVAFLIVGILSLKPMVHAASETGGIPVYKSENIGLSPNYGMDNSDLSLNFPDSEKAFFLADTIKKKKKSDNELEKALKEKKEMEADRDIDFDNEVEFNHQEMMKEVQEALKDVQEDLRDIKFDFDMDKIQDEFDDFEFNFDEIEFPDSIEMKRIREDLKISFDEFKEFSQKDLQIDFEQIKMEMKAAMENMKDEMDEFKESDWKRIQDEIKKSIEEWKKSEEYKKMDTLSLNSSQLDLIHEKKFNQQQQLMAEIQYRIQENQNTSFELQHKLQRKIELKKQLEDQGNKKSELQ